MGEGDYSREAIIFVFTQEWIEVMCEWFKEYQLDVIDFNTTSRKNSNLKRTLYNYCFTVFPRIMAGGDYFFFRIKRGDYFKYCSLEVVP